MNLATIGSLDVGTIELIVKHLFLSFLDLHAFPVFLALLFLLVFLVFLDVQDLHVLQVLLVYLVLQDLHAFQVLLALLFLLVFLVFLVLRYDQVVNTGRLNLFHLYLLSFQLDLEFQVIHVPLYLLYVL